MLGSWHGTYQGPLPYPGNVRVNATFPFPSLVDANGPIYILKATVCTLKYYISQIPVAVPPPGAFPTDYVLVWDSILTTLRFGDAAAGAAGVALADPNRARRAYRCSRHRLDGYALGRRTRAQSQLADAERRPEF